MTTVLSGNAKVSGCNRNIHFQLIRILATLYFGLLAAYSFTTDCAQTCHFPFMRRLLFNVQGDLNLRLSIESCIVSEIEHYVEI